MSRDKKLMALRDTAIQTRYKEIAKSGTLQSTEIVQQLKYEFYLTERTIIDIVYGSDKNNIGSRKNRSGCKAKIKGV